MDLPPRVAERLADHPLFGGFSPAELDELLATGALASVEPGEAVVRSGEPGRYLGLILSGRLEATGEDETGRERCFAELGELDYFGEISLISGEPTTADVRAITPARVLLIPHDAVSAALTRHPEALQQLARTVSHRLRSQIQIRSGVEMQTEDVGRLAVSRDEGTSAAARVLVVECGPERLRYSYFDVEREFHNREGVVEGLHEPHAEHVQNHLRGKTVAEVPGGLPAALRAVLDTMGGPEGLTTVVHIIARGGEAQARPVTADAELAAALRRIPSPPRELAANVEGLELCLEAAPTVSQVAVFDTAWFAGLPPAAFLYALPYEAYREHGLRRHGRHGLVHHQAAWLASEHLDRPLDELRLVTCYVGDVCSVCAVDHGRAVEVSAGLSSAGELPGPTSVGAVEPDVMRLAVQARSMGEEDAWRHLGEQSGLTALAGRSGDISALLDAAESGDGRASLAIDVWTHAVRKCLGGYVAVLGGADALVLTGHHVEARPELRRRLCGGLEGLGLELDLRLNHSPETAANGATDLAGPRSSSRLLVVPTDPHRMAAGEALAALGRPGLAGIFRRRRQPVPIGISAHHVHLSREHVAALFGEGHQLTFRAPLTQPGQFACEEAVTLVGPKGRVERVRVLGPVRPETQVEISRTEEFQLGIDAPIRASGNLQGSPGLRLEGPAGPVDLAQGVICAARHVHMSPEDALRFRLRDRDRITVCIEGERGVSFRDVLVRVHPDFRLDMHVDTDEANAAELDRDAVGYVESIERGS